LVVIMTILDVRNLRKDYGSFRAVNDVTFAVEPGEFVSLLGPSGCGKTTTLQMIAGFVTPTAGSVRLEGKDLVKAAASARGLGVVFQSYALFPHMTVSENVGFGLDMRKMREPQRSRRIMQMLQLVQLDGLEGRLPRHLSGGQQQRVALARALVIAPPILLLDEPLSNLDAKLRADMQFELRRIQRSVGTTTIMVTHDQDEALTLSDRLAVMSAGRIVQLGTPLDVYEKPSSRFVAQFLGSTNLLSVLDDCRGDHGASLIVDQMRQLLLENQGRGTMQVSLRPEKIRLYEFSKLASGQLQGHVVLRLFCGDYWHYELDTPLGRLKVRRQNDGKVFAENQPVGFGWCHEDLVVVGDDHE
jgi:putative spermidine/putrescine transport system ATP-binding protein